MANYILLQRVIVGNGGVASVSFTNIPQTGYTDLKVVISARGSNANIFLGTTIRFNGDAGNNYSYKAIQGDGAGASSFSGPSQSSNFIGNLAGASATANTFGNLECYIPNYLSTTTKSISSDCVGENNATTSYENLVAGTWTGTAAINSITVLNSQSANFVQYSTFSLYGLSAVGVTPTVAPKASGGSITTDGTYWYHTFRSSGFFVPQVGLTCDALVVAGGGGGGQYAGGGGAGGVLAFNNQSLSPSTYSLTVGGGGAGVGVANTNSGNFSQFGSLTQSVGGGGSGGFNGSVYINGASGGSGGGGGFASNGGTGSQGFNGGNGSGGTSGQRGGGGGGGAAGNGVAGTAASPGGTGGNGGLGTDTVTNWGSLTSMFSATSLGVSGRIAGGGGGGVETNNIFGLGSGGGSNGSGQTTTTTAATANTGGGGGGGGQSAGANGGSGVIVVRYLVA